MRHYFLILLLTWASILGILLGSWSLLLMGIILGDFTIFAPIMFVMLGIALFSRTPWYKENIHEPLRDSIEWGNSVEMVIHVQLFTIICGVVGLGLGIAAMSAFYPLGAKVALQRLAASNDQWYEFARYTPMSILSGTLFGFLFYSYLFADAKNNRTMKRLIIIGGFVLFAIVGLFFGGEEKYFLVNDR